MSMRYVPMNPARVALAWAAIALGALLPTAASTEAVAQEPPRAFSFAVYGDSRPMMYLPYKQGQAAARDLMVEMFQLVLPQKVAEAVVKRDVKFTYDPVTKDLIQIDMPFDTRYERTRMTLNQGWVTEASVEDVKLLPGVRRTMFRLEGGTWVMREIVNQVKSGRAKFVIDAGDLVWWGNQGRTVSDSPYWKRMDELMLSQLPTPDNDMLAAGLDGRYFIGIGNHEVWGDPKIEGVLSSLPHLKKLGVTPERLIYKFDFKAFASSFFGAGDTTIARRRDGTAIGRSTRNR
jgi:hypothetical protein